MPIQSPPWTDFMLCPVCAHEFAANLRAPITLGCGHSICKNCLTTLHRKQCPYDQTDIQKNFDNLPINYALLQLTTTNIDSLEREVPPSTVKALTSSELKCYELALKCIEELALLLKPNGNISGLLSRPMQRKLVTLVQCQLLETEGRARSLRAVRSLGERTVTELILQHQNAHQLSTNLWAAVRSRGCQFLGPAMQEEVLKLVLLALEDGSPLSRKILVMYVVQKLEATFPQASKTSIGHVVQLLYRASCFKVSKREGDSSLMTLKEEFRTYDALRREHDTQIVQIATEAGLRIAPDQWSALLYGDSNHKSHMQSIIDKQQSPSSFAQSVDELMLALQRTGDPANLARLRNDLENLSKIDPSMDLNVNTSWIECADSLRAVREVVLGLFEFVHHHGKSKIQESYNQHASRYKVSLCRELQTRGTCARGQNCSFAHSDDELERYRAKYKKNSMRTIIQNNNASASNGPIPKVNTAATNNHHHHPNYPKCPAPNDTVRTLNFKQIPYRSENSLHNHSSAAAHQQQTPHNHHLRPSNAYNSTTGSSSSTPNLTQMQLSPNPPPPPIAKSTSPQINSRFPFNQRPNVDPSKGVQFTTGNYAPLQHYNNNQRPPLSAPPIATYNNNNNNNKKPISPYHSAVMSNRNIQQQPARLHGMDNGNGYFQSQNQITSSSPQMYRNDKYHPWQQQQQQPRSPNNIHCQTLKTSKSNSAPSSAADNRVPVDLLFQQQCNIDELDGISMWKNLPPPMTAHASGYLFPNSSGSTVASNKEKFIRSDSILASSNNDETFDNMTATGKYGAIGGLNKSPDASQQWSGLQLTMNNRFDTPGSSNNNNNNNNLGGNVLKIVDVMSKNGDHSISQSTRHHPYGGINGNFLNINPQLTSNAITKPTNDNDYWSIKDSSSTKDLDIGALGNGMSVLNLLDLINE